MKYYWFIIVEEKADNNGIVYKTYEIINVFANGVQSARKQAKEIVACANANGWHNWKLCSKAYSSAEAARSAIEK